MPPRSDESQGPEGANNSRDYDSQNDDDDDAKPPFKQRLMTGFSKFIASMRLFIYNKEEQTMFGNTSSSWIKVSLYYFVFYVCLGLYYSGMVAVFGAIISRQSPRYLYTNNQMNDAGQVNIGMGFRPMPDITSTAINVYGDLASQNNTISSLRAYRVVFLTQYDTTYLEECSPTEPASLLQGTRSCEFSWSDIVTSETHPCSDTNQYGWPAGKPCVLVKLNKIYGWLPTPGNMADQVANFTGQPVLPIDRRDDNIFITCNGKTDADKAALGNNMTYYSILHPLGIPNYGGIPYYFFPYLNSPEHVQPFVLVQFTALPLEQTITVECRAWAPNIQQLTVNTQSRGMITISLYRSNKPAPPSR